MKTKTSQKRKDGLKRQSEIMDIALSLFAEKGYHPTSITDIIGKAGIAKGTFYLHFEGKEDILEMIIDTRLKVLYEFFNKLDISMNKPVSEIKKMYVDVAKMLAGAPEVKQFAVLLLRDAVALSGSIKDKVNTFFKLLIDMSAGYISDAQEKGRVIKSLDPMANSICIVGSIKEIVFRWAVLDEDIDVISAVSTATDIFFKGMLVDEN